MTEGSSPQTILEVLGSDHDSLTERLAEPVLVAPGESGGVARTEVVMDMVRHFVAEEEYLYPTLRARADRGPALVEDDFRAARACERELRRLERHGITGDELAAAVADIRRRFGEHVTHQQATVFPALREVSNRVELLELGEEALGAEQLAPTRPRHVVLEAAGANMLAGLVEGFVDRLRDFYSGRGVRREDQ